MDFDGKWSKCLVLVFTLCIWMTFGADVPENKLLIEVVTNPTKPTCFIEELPRDSLLVATYGFLEKADLLLNIYDERKSLKMEKDLIPSSSSKFSFHAKEQGVYEICIASKKRTAAEKKYLIEFIIDIRENNFDELLEKYPSVSHLDAFKKEIAFLESDISLLLKEMEYVHEQNDHFATQASRINSRTVIWNILEALAIVSVGVYQILHLKSYFRTKSFA
eukprot:snap_masked-scaffold_2-processed-gene-3.26-mRNA-1 protein AED:1.00 eAED:1.00 QI:0/-1/0/0/-1/1/1/0/219